MTTPGFPKVFWIGLAREQLRQKFALAAGVNPNSGFASDEDEVEARRLSTAEDGVSRGCAGRRMGAARRDRPSAYPVLRADLHGRREGADARLA